jgi:hypothetical protein
MGRKEEQGSLVDLFRFRMGGARFEKIPRTNKQQWTKEAYLITEKAGRILQMMKERDRQASKHWKPYNGPLDWDFIVLNAPKKHLPSVTPYMQAT